MLEFEFEVLSSLGLTPSLASSAAGVAAAQTDNTQLMRITEVHRETVVLDDGRADFRARPLPRLARWLAEQGTALAVGDWVLVAVDLHRELWVTERVPPSSHIVRRDGDGRRHPVVSNVDVALLVMGLDDDFNPRRLERFLALVHGDAIVPVVVLTKRDVAAPSAEALAERLHTLRGRVPADVEVVAVNATHESAAQALAHYLRRGQTLVLLGSSGAGKSTLTNTLLGAHVQDTGAVRVNDGRGKHTTTSRSLHRLPNGACVIDTPGLRTLRPDGDERSLAGTFADIESLAERCRFRDCRHQEEPGCAVREGVDADRLRNFHKLLREARRDTMTALDRQRQVAMWKERGRASKVRMKAKRGE
jgi:ribosome biogenesis GTPase / thiamine phosphate phosphatase